MQYLYINRFILLLVLSCNCILFGRPPSISPDDILKSLMENIQTNGEMQLPTNSHIYWAETRSKVDQHLQLILQTSKSNHPDERRLAALLLSMASPTIEGVDLLIDLASDDIPDVRYAALVGLATVTDGTHNNANKAILSALSESGNASITRDAALAASHLKITDAIPLIEKLIESEDVLNNRYGIEAAERYGYVAAPLLPALKKKLEETSDNVMVKMINNAISSIEQPKIPNTSSISPRINFKSTETLKTTTSDKQIIKSQTKNAVSRSAHNMFFLVAVIALATYLLYLFKKSIAK